MRKLRGLRTDPSTEPILSFPAYASAVASHACYAYLRRRYPEWTRLKNQVRYLLTHDPELALRYSQADESSCVLTAWDNTRPGPASLDSPRGNADEIDAHTLSLRDVIKAILRRASRPVEINDLVSTIAELRGIRDGGLAPAAAGSVESLADRHVDPRQGDGLDALSFLKRVWEQVRQLPLRQRTALLLNLRDEGGRGVLALLPDTGTASVGQIAGVLGMPPEDLARLWNDLPIDDLQIAGRLGVSRQQVINLRKAARARLARRMAW